MITQSLRDTIANMTEPELIEVLECIEARAEKLPAPNIFDNLLGVKDARDSVRDDLYYVRELLKDVIDRL